MNYTDSQLGIILKGIASQLLNTHEPSIDQLRGLLDSFDIDLNNTERHIVLTNFIVDETLEWKTLPFPWIKPDNSDPLSISYLIRSNCTDAMLTTELLCTRFYKHYGYDAKRNDRYLDSRFGEVIRCFTYDDKFWAVIRSPRWL